MNQEIARKGTPLQSFLMAFGFSILVIGTYTFSLSIDKESYLLAVGIHPQHIDGLSGIVTSQFGHATQDHLIMNLFPLLFLVFIIVYSQGVGRFLYVYLMALLGSGILTWLIAPPSSIVVGISGVVAGLAGYLVVLSGVKKDFVIFGMSGVLAAIIFISILSTILDNQSHSSWQAHIGGLLTGIIVACIQLIRERKREELMPSVS